MNKFNNKSFKISLILETPNKSKSTHPLNSITYFLKFLRIKLHNNNLLFHKRIWKISFQINNNSSPQPLLWIIINNLNNIKAFLKVRWLMRISMRWISSNPNPFSNSPSKPTIPIIFSLLMQLNNLCRITSMLRTCPSSNRISLRLPTSITLTTTLLIMCSSAWKKTMMRRCRGSLTCNSWRWKNSNWKVKTLN